MLDTDFEIKPRQSGKTNALKLKALELSMQFEKVIWISFNRNAHKDIEHYFKNINADIECMTLSIFDHRTINVKKIQTEIPPEIRLLGLYGIHIIMDEFELMNQEKLKNTINSLAHSKDQFFLYGKSSKYK